MAKDKIQAFKVQFSLDEIDAFLEAAKEIVTKGALIPGKYNAQLEEAFADFSGSKFARAVSTGTVALEVIFRCLGLKNKEILVPSNTNYATAEAAIRASARITLYDSDLYPDFDSIKQMTSPETGAIVIVHIGGYITPKIEQIRDYCNQKGIYLIEDASHAHGSRYNSTPAGSFGVASAFSMFATKVITTSEGGLITTNDESIWTSSKVYRDQGKDTEGIRNVVEGSSWRMSELHAALGVVQMSNADSYIKHNNTIAHYYKQHISTSDRIQVPLEENGVYSGYKFIILLDSKDERDSLKDHLIADNIKPGKGVYDIPLHLQPTFSSLNVGKYPKAEKFAETHLCLPLWKGLTQLEVDEVIESVNNWMKS